MRYVLSDEHPLRPERVKLAVELIRDRGLAEEVKLAPPREASAEELRLCHLSGYVELVRLLSDPFMVDAIDRSEIFEAGFASEEEPHRRGDAPGSRHRRRREPGGG